MRVWTHIPILPPVAKAACSLTVAPLPRPPQQTVLAPTTKGDFLTDAVRHPRPLAHPSAAEAGVATEVGS